MNKTENMEFTKILSITGLTRFSIYISKKNLQLFFVTLSPFFVILSPFYIIYYD